MSPFAEEYGLWDTMSVAGCGLAQGVLVWAELRLRPDREAVQSLNLSG